MPPRRRPALPPPRASIDATTCPEGEIESSATNGPSRRRRRRSPPAPTGLATVVLEDLPDDVIAKILLLLPQDDPSSLLSASLVCKHWLGIVTDPDFLRRPEAFHRTPTMLGFFPDIFNTDAPRLIATTASAFSLPSAVPDRDDLWQWVQVDCRHGRALFYSFRKPNDLLVWEPLTSKRCLVPNPPGYVLHYHEPNAAVVCAVKGCGCQGGPFLVLFVFSDNPQFVMLEEVEACVYSSVTGEWGERLKIDIYGGAINVSPSILIGRNLYFRLLDGILEYDFDGQEMALILPPLDQFGEFDEYGMAEDDGQLGVVVLEGSTLSLWSTDQKKDDDARWARRWVMQLDNPLQLQAEQIVGLLGFAEGVNITFVAAGDSIFTIELKSRKVKKYCRWGEFRKVFPLVTFYRPGPVRWRGGEEVPSSSAGRATSPRGRTGEASANEASRKSKRAKKPNTKFIGGDWVN